MIPAAHRPRKTVEDYLALPDDVSAELIDGELYPSPPFEFDRQRLVARLARYLADHVDHQGLGSVLTAPIDAHLPSGDVVRPDALFVSKERDGIRDARFDGTPDLVIEVVSQRHPERARALKRRLYASNEVPEYWIVDPEEHSVEVLRFEDGAFVPAGYFTDHAVLVSETFSGLVLLLGGLWS